MTQITLTIPAAGHAGPTATSIDSAIRCNIQHLLQYNVLILLYNNNSTQFNLPLPTRMPQPDQLSRAIGDSLQWSLR